MKELLGSRPLLTVNQVWGSDETGLTLPESWFYCK